MDITSAPQAAGSESLNAALLGLVEGLTEFLPVSSTGHLLLAERFLAPQSEAFNVIIQGGAVLAIFAVFRTQLTQLWRTRGERPTQVYLAQLAVAFGITAIGGLALKALGMKLPETARPVAWATFVGGILFLAVEGWLARRQATGGAIGWTAAIAVGCGQLLAAAFPGASRSGSTILLALLCGVSRAAATEFSFLLGVPTLLAAGAVEGLHAVKDNGFAEPLGPLLIASVVSLVTAFAVVRWLLGYVRHHTFVPFALYRLVLGGLLLWWA